MADPEYSDIVNQAVPYMLLLTAVEFVFGVLKNKKKYHRLNDSLSRFVPPTPPSLSLL